MSVDDFVGRFAPSAHDLQTIRQTLNVYGITVDEVYADKLLIRATGPVASWNAMFSTDLHDYTSGSRRYHKPHHAPSIPTLLRDLLYVTEGLDQSASYRPHSVNGHSFGSLPHTGPAKTPPPGSTATGSPGDYTTGDVANLYNINPLYAHHVDGHGRTIGIATLAGFDPADAYTYWSTIGLTVKPNRITQVHVDGGAPISSEGGSGETCLDVEQSGGLAPQAKMVVYDAPNSDSGFIDMFYKAASDNVVDTLSVSWGSSEVFYFAALEGGVDYTNEMLAFHQVFLESAAQGISVFAASGDSGAIDTFGILDGAPLTVDYPASDPAITAAGGTTVPATMDFGFAAPLVVTTEQVWGWDYLDNYFGANGVDISDEVFPTGGGGGVSVFWPRPAYQNGVGGMHTSEPGQTLAAGGQTLMTLPSHFAGRNVPDASLNADPETGYIVYSTSDGGLIDFYGGTSFVAPQLNGITALLSQSAGGRLGLLNPMLYRAKAHSGAFRDITAGDNWFYQGVAGYDPGAGLGVLDVANLANAIANDRH
jgi:subtilase family serine protease